MTTPVPTTDPVWPRGYLKSVTDPISQECDAAYEGHGRGLSQRGANRWQCSLAGRGPVPGQAEGQPWSVQWTRPAEILCHYYPDVDLRDAGHHNQGLSPSYRWSLLDITWHTPACPDNFPLNGACALSVSLQNTGTEPWPNFGFGMAYLWTRESGVQQRRGDVVGLPLSQASSVAEGEVLHQALYLPSPSEAQFAWRPLSFRSKPSQTRKWGLSQF